MRADLSDNKAITFDQLPKHLETMAKEITLLRQLEKTVTRYCEPFRPNKPTISIDTLRQTVLRIKREIEAP